MESITTVIKYLSNTAKTNDDVVNPALSFHERKLAYRLRPESDYDRRQITVNSMRGRENDFSLEQQGFELSSLHSRCPNFYDSDEVKQTYYPEIVALLKNATGAKFVHPYDHTLRYQTEIEALAAPPDNTTVDVHGPAKIVHIDDTPRNARRMIGDELTEVQAARWEGKPFAIINVWKPLKPVRRDPLALIDARTISSQDRLVQPLPAPSEFGGDWEVFMLRSNGKHEWWYQGSQQTHEALIFKIYDSRAEESFMGVAHVSVEVPEAGDGVKLEARESIEVRSLVFF